MDNLTLEPVSEAHFNTLKNLLEDPLISQNLEKGMIYDNQEIMLLFNQMQSYWKHVGFGYYAIKLENIIIGFGGFSYANGEIELSYFLDPKWWGKGLGSLVVEKLIDQGFNNLGINKIKAFVEETNIASEKILAKNHFVKEKVCYFNKKYWNSFCLENNCGLLKEFPKMEELYL